MAILDPTVQIALAKMFDLMWDDFLEGSSEDTEAYIDAATGLTEEFELTEEMHATGDFEGEVGDTMRRLTKDGEAVIALAGEANKQEKK